MQDWTTNSVNEHALEMERLKRENEAKKQAELAEKKAAALAEIEHRKEAFHARAVLAGDIEATLTSHASLLHGVFVNAVEEYAGCGDQDKMKIHGAIALRAQNYCRITLATMDKMKMRDMSSTQACKKRKIEDPAIKKEQHEEMDARGTATAGGANPDVATMENHSPENG